MSLIRTIAFGVLAAFVLFACNGKKLDPEPKVYDDPLEAVGKLNRNVEGLRNMADALVIKDSIAIYSIHYNDDGSVLYQLNMKDGRDVALYSEIVTDTLQVPVLSMIRVEDVYYWMVNGSLLVDSNGKGVVVTDETRLPAFIWQEGRIGCTVEGVPVDIHIGTKADYKTRDVAMEYDTDSGLFKFRLASGFRPSLPVVKSFHLLKEGVKNQSFYKDVFLDAGIGLNSSRNLAAIKYLGLSVEGIMFSRSDATEEEYTIQSGIIAGDDGDLNGRLLYPDGQPRYRLLFVVGGSSTTHGKSLYEKGLENMRLFVENGGSYVGTCAGAFFASNGYDGKKDYPYYLSIWPGMMEHSGLSNEYFGMFIEEYSPLLRFYDYGGDHYVDSIRHNRGGYPIELPAGTEVLARFDYPRKGDVHKAPSIWAIKKSPGSGRVVQTGSHPEAAQEGERRDLTAAMILYALDGVAPVTIKGFLKNGVVRKMDKLSSDQDPDYSRIGDLQTHHFASYIPPDAKNIRVEVNCASDCDLALMMSHDSFAFYDTAEYLSADRGSNPRLELESIREGLWYIAVKCLTTVTVEETDYGQDYSGNTWVLNGVPYSVSVSWE